METSLTGVFQFIVRKDAHLKWPRAETPTHWITMGLDPDLTAATTIAVHETLDFLVNEKKLTREEACCAMLASVAVDFEITRTGGRDQGRPRHDPQKHLQEAHVAIQKPGEKFSIAASLEGICRIVDGWSALRKWRRRGRAMSTTIGGDSVALVDHNGPPRHPPPRRRGGPYADSRRNPRP